MLWLTTPAPCYGLPLLPHGMAYHSCPMLWLTTPAPWYGLPLLPHGMAYHSCPMLWLTTPAPWYGLPFLELLSVPLKLVVIVPVPGGTAWEENVELRIGRGDENTLWLECAKHSRRYLCEGSTFQVFNTALGPGKESTLMHILLGHLCMHACHLCMHATSACMPPLLTLLCR